MGRIATTALVLALLLGAAVAFAVSERLKLEHAPITGTHVDKVFSPVCGCAKRRATIAFRLRKRGRIELSMIDAEGHEVRRLVDGRLLAAGRHHFTWNGRDDAGLIVAEGAYRPKVVLESAHRTIVLPNPIRVDTTRPRIALVSLEPRAISPDGDGRSDLVRVRYRVSEKAHGLLFVDGKRRVRGRRQRLRDELDWFGKVDGTALVSGRHRLELAAEDLGGNASARVPVGIVQIRYVEIARPVLRAAAGERVAVPVSADARTVLFALRKGARVVARGFGPPSSLRVTAPKRPGRYVLLVEAAGHTARAVLVVMKSRR